MDYSYYSPYLIDFAELWGYRVQEHRFKSYEILDKLQSFSDLIFFLLPIKTLVQILSAFLFSSFLTQYALNQWGKNMNMGKQHTIAKNIIIYNSNLIFHLKITVPSENTAWLSFAYNHIVKNYNIPLLFKTLL